jgi:hypothetical protein
MLTNKLIIGMAVIVVSIVNVSAKNILNIYDSHKKVYSSKTMNPHYVGPIFATGGAMADINRLIKEMDPEKVGNLTCNNLTLIESAPLKNQVYTFKKVKAYQVKKSTSNFSVILLKSTMNGENYDILIEIKEGPNYDRTITVYKDGKPQTLILWLDNSKITQKKSNPEI